VSRMRCSAKLIRALTPVFAGYAERCTAGPGPFQTPALGTVPGGWSLRKQILPANPSVIESTWADWCQALAELKLPDKLTPIKVSAAELYTVPQVKVMEDISGCSRGSDYDWGRPSGVRAGAFKFRPWRRWRAARSPSCRASRK
jgi:hypothetical protein